jgi:hypothetical protein
MNKNSLAAVLALLLAPALGLARQAKSTSEGAWSGVIINATCSVDEAFAEAAKCTAATPDGALALYDDTIRKIYELDPQDQAKGQLGRSVTVRGSLEVTTIHVASIQTFAEVGLRAGQKAPDFSARDQFGETQTLETREGEKARFCCFTVPRIGARTAKGS